MRLLARFSTRSKKLRWVWRPPAQKWQSVDYFIMGRIVDLSRQRIFSGGIASCTRDSQCACLLSWMYGFQDKSLLTVKPRREIVLFSWRKLLDIFGLCWIPSPLSREWKIPCVLEELKETIQSEPHSVIASRSLFSTSHKCWRFWEFDFGSTMKF